MARAFQGESLEPFERILKVQERLLEDRLAAAEGAAGGRVVVIAPAGEADGVENGTVGELLGVLIDLGGKQRAAIRLDDNGETIFVCPQCLSHLPVELP